MSQSGRTLSRSSAVVVRNACSSAACGSAGLRVPAGGNAAAGWAPPAAGDPHGSSTSAPAHPEAQLPAALGGHLPTSRERLKGYERQPGLVFHMTGATAGGIHTSADAAEAQVLRVTIVTSTEAPPQRRRQQRAAPVHAGSGRSFAPGKAASLERTWGSQGCCMPQPPQPTPQLPLHHSPHLLCQHLHQQGAH